MPWRRKQATTRRHATIYVDVEHVALSRAVYAACFDAAYPRYAEASPGEKQHMLLLLSRACKAASLHDDAESLVPRAARLYAVSLMLDASMPSNADDAATSPRCLSLGLLTAMKREDRAVTHNIFMGRASRRAKAVYSKFPREYHIPMISYAAVSALPSCARARWRI